MTAYSADSHIVEPAELFGPLERKYGERAPRIVNDPDWGDFLVTPGVTGREAYSPRYAGVAVGRQGIAGGRLAIRKSWNGSNVGTPGCAKGSWTRSSG